MSRLQVDYLRAALCCAATKEVRHYLNGAQVEVREDSITYVGNDGAHLFACTHPTNDVPTELVGRSFIVSNNCLKKLKGCDEFEIEKLDTTAFRLRGCARGKRVRTSDVELELIDGTYPDWRRVLPKTTTGTVGQYNPQLLQDIADAFAHLGCSTPPHVHHNGDGPAVVTQAHSHALGVVGALRVHAPTLNPAEIRATVTGEKPEKAVKKKREPDAAEALA